MGYTKALQLILHPCLHFARFHSVIFEREGNVLFDSRCYDLVVDVLKKIAERFRTRRSPIDYYASALWFFQTSQKSRQRSLARTVRPHAAHSLALPNSEG